MMVAIMRVGEVFERDELLRRLVDIQYERNDVAFERGRFRVRGDCVEVWPSYEEFAVRIELWGDEIDQLSRINPTSGNVHGDREPAVYLPGKALCDARRADCRRRGGNSSQELEEQLEGFRDEGKLLEAQRLNARTRFDIEMLLEVGYCPGIENYSRPLSGRPPARYPTRCSVFFPEDFLLLIDESHVTVPQIRAMYAGDRSRKQTLVEHGFRLPSALDNRPLKFEEWEAKIKQVVHVSATPVTMN